MLVPAAPAAPPPDAADGAAAAPQTPTSRPGASIFTIEGRSAPGLFVVGWLATLIGVACIIVAVLAGGGTASVVLLVVGLILLSVGLIAAAGSQGIERRDPSEVALPRTVTAARLRGGDPRLGPDRRRLRDPARPARRAARRSDRGASVGHDPGRRVRRAGAPARRRHGRPRLAHDGGRAAQWQRGRRDGPRRAVGGPRHRRHGRRLGACCSRSSRSSRSARLPPTGDAAGFALSLLAGVIVAPFGEEILFRAFATTAWVRGLGYRRGLVLAALVFALAHVLTIGGTNAGEAFGLAVVGFGSRIPVALALGWIFLRRGTVWASFGLHAAFNGILLVLAEAASRSLSLRGESRCTRG